jgi:predicted glycoside hydrolase/deacetylase ChbG (UPF0249 family)
MTPTRRRLIVNADDLGRTPGINEGIFKAHERGIVTSATLMVNYPASAAAARALPRFSSLGVGLHVALSGGPSALPPERIRSLVGGDGLFPSRPEGLVEADPQEIFQEVQAQLNLFRTLTGRLPTHLDGHHHCHRLPAVARALISIAREEKLPVRSATPAVATLLRQESVATTDHFDESFYGAGVSRESLSKILRQVPAGTTELMCHPAVIDPELRGASSYVDERQAELALLTDAEVLALVRSQGLELIHFGDL